LIGTITRTHGVRGEMKVLEGLGCSGAWRTASEVYVGSKPEKARRYRVSGIRGAGKFAILALARIDSLEAARQLKGESLYVPRGMLPPLEEGAYYAGDLLGMHVEDVSGRSLGVLDEIFDNGAHEVYVVRKGATEILIPVIDGVVVSVDTSSGRLVVELPEGLPGTEQG
jgi:16S rRNA processing protein RimM